MTDVCRTPEKQRYPTVERAESVAAWLAHKWNDCGLYAYQCGDHWHVGHPVPRALRQAS